MTTPLTERRTEIAKVLACYLSLPRGEVGSAITDLLAEVDRLTAAIRKHHDQKADDRCWLDDCDLYLAAGLPMHDATVGDKTLMLANCKRFIEQRCGWGGGWKSYAELEAENERLARMLAECHELLARLQTGEEWPADKQEIRALLWEHGQMK